jgi:phosphatidate cytidylyltransferase
MAGQKDLKESSMFKKRTIVTIIGVPLVAAFIWFDKPIPWFTLLGIAWGVGAAYEFYRILSLRGIAPLTYFGLLWVAIFMVTPHLTSPQTLPVLLTGMVVLPLIIMLWRKGKENAFTNWAWTVAGILYIGWLLSLLVHLRNLPDGRAWVFLSMLCTFGSDISAYLIGSAWGKHKMAPYISPKKSWEGAAAGVVGSIVVALVIVWLFPVLANYPVPDNYIRPLGYGEGVILGILISVAGQVGDLVKSLFKRNIGVKDSSRAIPGHGGFLDRMDSLAFAGMALYFYVVYLG